MVAKRKILFMERDGVLLVSRQLPIDRIDRFELAPGVIAALLSLRDVGYEFVMVSNQPGFEIEQDGFDGPQKFLVQLLASQGIKFAGIHVDFHQPTEHAFMSKPQLGMVLDYLKSGELDLNNSIVVGVDPVDQELAKNMSLNFFELDHDDKTWLKMAEELVNAPRLSTVQRKTKETDISVKVNLDSHQQAEIDTGIGFFDHMLEQLSKHGGFFLSLQCQGDLEVDEHHTVEDCALALGQALSEAIGDKRGIQRYGFALPMDEASAEVKLDLSGRPYFVFEGQWSQSHVGKLSTQMVTHFFHSLADALRATLHLRVQGDNCHHMVEGAFKAVAKSLGQAIKRSGTDLPSTKGVL